jgi:hypothetical protein
MVGAARGRAAGSVEFEHGDVVSGHVKWSVTTDRRPSAVQGIPVAESLHSQPFFVVRRPHPVVGGWSVMLAS